MSRVGEYRRDLTLVVSTALRADRRGTLIGLLLTVVAAPAPPLYAWQLKAVIDAVVAGRLTHLVLAAAVLAGIWTGAVGCSGIGAMVLHGVKERTELRIDGELIELSSGIAGLDHLQRADYLDRLALLRQERLALNQAPVAAFNVVAAVVQVAVTTVLLGVTDPVLLLLPIFAAPSAWLRDRGQRRVAAAEEATTSDRRLADGLLDLSTLPSTGAEVRLYGLAGELAGRQRSAWRRLTVVQSRARWTEATFAGLGGAVFALGYLGCIGLIVAEVLNGRARLGDVILAIVATGLLHHQIGLGVQEFGSTLDARRTIGRWRWLLDYAASTPMAPTRPRPVPDQLNRGVSLQHIRFRYPGTAQDTLRDLSLDLPAGAAVAIVGENGAGKTTIAQLLCRFYDPGAGRVLVDDVDLTEYDPATWRSHLSAAFQDFVRFELALADAVGLGDLDRMGDRQAVLEAMDRAGADGLVEDVPGGLEADLGTRYGPGVELSGGQWQKTALARAMMRARPLLLILDEPTASLDPLAEHALFERYARAGRDRSVTTVLVSHRFATVRTADRILVVHEGEIVEGGTHAELMTRGGLYAELYELQARDYR